jgi:hypothetical protein
MKQLLSLLFGLLLLIAAVAVWADLAIRLGTAAEHELAHFTAHKP